MNRSEALAAASRSQTDDPERRLDEAVRNGSVRCPASVAILIPAYQPDAALVDVVQGLADAGAERVVVINDGSRPSCDSIFDQVAEIEIAEVIPHAVNLGKGRALKTGLNHIHARYPDVAGIVTADADGQHAVEDICRVATRLVTSSDSALVLGTRTISSDIPFRSWFGNQLTRYVFRFLVGKNIADTQTGLRGIPREVVPTFLRLQGEGYEYELNMLIATKKESIAIEEESIRTIYLDGNKSSHFNPLLDSMRIYFLLIRFVFSSLLAAGVDFLVFWIAFSAGASLLASFVIGRIVSGTINFAVNKSLVFHNRDSVLSAITKYCACLFAFMAIAYFLTRGMHERLGWDETPAKAVVETLLFFVGFLVQRDVIFYNRADDARGE